MTLQLDRAETPKYKAEAKTTLAASQTNLDRSKTPKYDTQDPVAQDG